MGYYENPPILNLNSGADKITAGIMDAADSISKAFIKRGEDRRDEEKERKLSIQKIQDAKNRTDLEYAETLSNWEIQNPSDNSDISSQARAMLQSKIKLAADAKIALTMETDPAKREEYLKHITNANKFMDVAAKAGKGFGMEAATYGDTNAIAMNVPGGWAVTGDGEVRKNRTYALDIMSKRTGGFESSGVRLIDKGDHFDAEFYGKRKGEDTEFRTVISSLDYLNSDENGNGGLLHKVENANEFFADAKKSVYDAESGKILETMVDPELKTVDIGNGYQLAEAKRLNLAKATEEIRKKAAIKASGYMKANKPSDMWSLVNWTLGMGEGYYENKFLKADDGRLLTTAEQQEKLTNLLTEKAVANMTGTLRKTNNGQDVWVSGIEQRVKEGKITKGTDGKTVSENTNDGLTKAQKTLNAKILNAIQKGIPVSARGLTMRKNRAGNWEVVDTKDGIPVSGSEYSHNPWSLQGYLGGSLSEERDKAKKLPIINNKIK